MGSLLIPLSLPIASPNHPLISNPAPNLKPISIPKIASFLSSTSLLLPSSQLHPFHVSYSNQGNTEEDIPESQVQELRVPDSWLLPSNALQESEWLRVTLHKWLDDEYCPEPTNVEISNVAARSYYESLIANESDLGEILLKMVGDLEAVSFQESFHGVFSSANAAIHLITLRKDSVTEEY